MKFFRIVIIAAYCAACASGSSARAADVEVSRNASTDVVIRLHEKSSCSSPLVRLGDCADVLANDAELQQQLEQLTLFPAPPQGRSVSVNYDWIQSRLSAHGVNMAKVAFTGSLQVTVAGPEAETKPQLPDRKPVIQLVKHEPAERPLTHRDRERAQRFFVELIRRELVDRDAAWNSAEIAATVRDADVAIVNSGLQGTWRVQSTSPAEATDSGYSQVWTFSCRDADRIEHQIDVAVEIVPAPQVLTLKRSVPAGHIVQTDDLEYATSTRRDVEPVHWEELVGKETVRPVRAAMPLTRRDVRSPVLVRHNDIVRVSVNVRGIRISKDFKARGEGGLGETVTLTSLDGRQKIAARVTGIQEAEIPMEASASAPIAEVPTEPLAARRFRRTARVEEPYPRDVEHATLNEKQPSEEVVDEAARPQRFNDDGGFRFLPPRPADQRSKAVRQKNLENE